MIFKGAFRMQEQVTILTAEQYFKKYGVDGIGKGADR